MQTCKRQTTFEKGSKTGPQNYFFISLQIIEMIGHDQNIFKQKENSPQISIWFSKKPSTNICLGHITDKIIIGFKKGFFTEIILIEL